MTPMPPHRLDRFEAMIDKRLRDVQVMDMLRAAFLIQQERVFELRSLEARTQGMLVSNGFKEIELLKNIAETMAKIECAEHIRAVKAGIANAGMPLPGAIVPQPDDLAVFATFDAVDRNLARQATEHVINMFRDGMDRSGRAKPTGPEKRTSVERERD
jgi:hypothetical protein